MKLTAIKKENKDWNLIPHNIFDDTALDEVINCSNCGKKIKFGEAYTSQRHFTDNGFWGLYECEECYFENR